MKRFYVKDRTGVAHYFRGRNKASAQAKCDAAFPAPHQDAGAATPVAQPEPAPSRQITIALNGARGIGKTTLLKRVLKPALKIAGIHIETESSGDGWSCEYLVVTLPPNFLQRQRGEA